MKGRNCLVVGGGHVALRKVETLLDYDTKITVVAPEVDAKLEMFARHKRIDLHKRPYKSPEASEYGFVISASDDMSVNQQVCDDCRQAGVLVNVADAPALCDFIFPAVVRRDCLTAAISTDGKAPFMSGHLRQVLETIFPKHWEKLMKLATAYRKQVQERWGDDMLRKTAAYERFVEADWSDMFKEMSNDEIKYRLEQMIELEPQPEPDSETDS
jgi:siroheme synthase-like protein